MVKEKNLAILPGGNLGVRFGEFLKEARWGEFRGLGF